MKKGVVSSILGFLFVVVLASLATASEAAPAATVDYTKAIVLGCSLFGAAIAIAFGSFGTALGMGNGLNAALNSVGRNPEAQGKVLITMMVGLAMIESLAIYALVISLILLYANPLLKFIGG
ncbi:MAG: ATP synthase F0 subunit C [Proteobacteria bacterium]|nr:ATP synthase F0 subunit C [Pseudomonadota bacterium]